jgi:hypothetical protein
MGIREHSRQGDDAKVQARQEKAGKDGQADQDGAECTKGLASRERDQCGQGPWKEASPLPC